MFSIRYDVEGIAALTFEPVREGVLSWNTFAPSGEIAFRLLRGGYAATPWLQYAQWSENGRRSFSAGCAGVRVEVDVVRADEAFEGVEVRAPDIALRAIAFAAPAERTPSLPYMGAARILDVPARSQYVVEEERGWCSAASLSMINTYHGIDRPVEETARNVFDAAYGGTGNWAFNMAYSGNLGLRAAVVYLRNLEHAQRFIDAGLPIALSYSWRAGELPGAPIEHSEGHLAVLCGFTSSGDCVLNDPAAPRVRAIYPRGALERLWLAAGGVAYAVAPVGREFAEIAAA